MTERETSGIGQRRLRPARTRPRGQGPWTPAPSEVRIFSRATLTRSGSACAIADGFFTVSHQRLRVRPRAGHRQVETTNPHVKLSLTLVSAPEVVHSDLRRYSTDAHACDVPGSLSALLGFHLGHHERQWTRWHLTDTSVVWHSFGRVRLATHSHTGTVCAVKILSKAQILNQDQLIHMKQEKAILDEVAYPFVVNLFGATQVSAIRTARPPLARTPMSNQTVQPGCVHHCVQPGVGVTTESAAEALTSSRSHILIPHPTTPAVRRTAHRQTPLPHSNLRGGPRSKPQAAGSAVRAIRRSLQRANTFDQSLLPCPSLCLWV